ncbi:mutS2 protein [Staphylococcus sp. CAG:324]|jgi:mutS2 protein|nr:mutS2 protein [Staphylococcus sp. CAG:324]
MNFQEKSINKLEFSLILDKLSEFAILPAVKTQISSLKPSSNINMLEEELTKTQEALRIIQRSMRAPLYMSCDYDKILLLLSKGAILSGKELYETVKLYETIRANVKFANHLKKDQIESQYFQMITSKLYLNESIEQMLLKALDEEGNVEDNASPKLKSLRKKLVQIELNLKQKLQEIVAKEAAKLSQTSIVLRDDRYCLAVKSEYKNHIKGIIHDTSASMQTIFIEPFIVSQMMSDKAKLQEEEKAEIHRILKELSQILLLEQPLLQENFHLIKEIDFIFAKGMLAKSYDGYRPKLNHQGRLNLIKARHPLLKVKKVIPNTVSFGDGYLGIIITGPNTGGKTVLLKTVGLLCTMIKYGLLIPADEKSDIMIFDQIFCDIGDDQSIESNLSTFSSHMTNITEIINNITPKSLVLFDEIGSGTDPIEGSNLAKAILNYLIKEKVSFITTTHYSDLKTFGFENPYVINASMEFDQHTLSPTYELKLGISGSSNAFNIAKRLGLKEEIINDAKKMAVTSDDIVRQLVLKLEKKAKQLEEQTLEYERLKEDTYQIKQEYDAKVKKFEKEKQILYKKAQAEADEFVMTIKNDALQIIEEAKKLKNDQVKLHEIIDVRHQVNNLDRDIVKEREMQNTDNSNLEVGDDVYITSYDQYGTISRILKDNQYEVSIGNMSVKLAKKELTKVKTITNQQPKEINFSFRKSKATISMTLDLRGKRYEDAKEALDKYIDDLVVVGLKQATIIHGYGTGVIRELVQNFLKNNKNIASYRYGGENEGGFGVTVITLK